MNWRAFLRGMARAFDISGSYYRGGEIPRRRRPRPVVPVLPAPPPPPPPARRDDRCRRS